MEDYTSEILPYWLYITKGYGFSSYDIDWSCPSDLKPYENAKEIECKKRDEEYWSLGFYIQSAVSVAIEHNFAKRAKSKYIDKPFLHKLDEQKVSNNLTEEQKIEQTKQLFTQLKIMQSNFELKEGRKGDSFS